MSLQRMDKQRCDLKSVGRTTLQNTRKSLLELPGRRGGRYSFSRNANKGFVLAVLTMMAVACAIASAHAAYPDRPIRMIVAFAPGGANDIVARTIAEPLRAILGQPVIVENVAGASGGIGTQRTIAAAPDGYTIQLGNSTEMVVNSLISPQLAYDVEKGLATVAYVGSAPAILVGKKDLRPNTLQELIAYMRAAPEPIVTGTPGVGTPQHLALELFKAKTGVRVTPVHYKGGGPVVADVIGGHVDVAITSLVSALPHLPTKRLRPYGVTTKTRSPLVPDLPALSETHDLTGFDIAPWFGFYVPARTPEAIVIHVQNAVLAALKDPKVRAKLEQQGVNITPEDRNMFKARMRDDVRHLQPVVKAADIKLPN
jgi:tripartite-type tricarboxylate transporter receptor subunit TctC